MSPEELHKALTLLENSGIQIYSADSSQISVVDPSCVLLNFQQFVDYAWVCIAVVTGMLLFGLAFSIIRNSKYDYWGELKKYILLFGILSVIYPIISFVLGENFISSGCDIISVQTSKIQKLLDLRNKKLQANSEFDLYEEFSIYDSGPKDPNVTPSVSTATDDSQDVPIENEQVSILLSNSTNSVQSAGNIDPNFASRAQPIDTKKPSKHIEYTRKKDSTKYQRHEGTLAWRNYNPGNITTSNHQGMYGSIGQNGRFAIYPSEQTGFEAIKKLLRSDSYNTKTLEQAINRYAPPNENDTKNYVKHVEQITGINRTTILKDMDDNQLMKLAEAIRELEGWRAGSITE